MRFAFAAALLSMIFFCGVPAFADTGYEVRGNISYYIPDDSDSWDNSFGFEGQLVSWITSELGIAVAAGISKWDAEDFSESYYDPYYDETVSVAVKGDIQLIPLGVSALIRPQLNEIELTLEAGMRYIYVNSNVYAAASVVDSYGSYFISEKIDIDNGIVGRVSADLGFPLSESTTLFGGLGYQFDISKGKATWADVHLGDNELEAFFWVIGLSVRY